MRYLFLLLLFTSTLLNSCGYRTFKFDEGDHSRDFRTGNINLKGWVAFSVIFSELSKYDVPETVDSLDYHKAFGMAGHHMECGPHADAAMLGWRYNAYVDSFELTAYTHHSCDDKPQHAYDDYMIRVGIGDPVTTYIKAGDGYWGYVIANRRDTIKIIHHRESDADVWRNIAGWIGGSYAAPNQIIYYVDNLKHRPFDGHWLIFKP